MAMDRGVELHILMGDARLRMAQPWMPIPDDSVTKNWKADDWKLWSADRWEKTGGPDHFYTALIVDAFSSDAIPIHLITKEAFQLYFSKLSEKGILCMHTSNRYVDLVRVCGDLATDLGYAWKRGHTEQDENDPGHFSSEWVMIARKPEYLEPDSPRPDPFNPGGVIQPHWAGCVNPQDWGNNTYWRSGSYVWTDDHHNMLSVFRPLLGRGGE
jgi:hypothetical protein